jgi:predicted nucleic-acid-binding Zn-ribbon protein
MKDRCCPKCQSQLIMEGVDILDRNIHGVPQPLRVHILEPEPPNHGFIWTQGEAYGAVRAWICASCGYTELYTDNLSQLHEYYCKGQV